ncbi:DGQHR domain-containing protein [Xenorhabdus griffiniae]|uniref:DGQHR domain-containing protein n=1 Tax=Xenorhabdus griffiniae TaxID=351672 RepID=A0ABY9XEV9_9GAMM|nr:DGQHR domain-containing protein [Xenorhabdus griffiniae]MBD1225978.1 DNA sulfur modification protein DndB [Xenorhabdus griffiniae]MBE8585904.1 DNA sulfur modification protein DndB [Xenorhabdus griffiniae]WMV71448.1 DGQHR domain-containing protein [Xenorhabdus griffiniae]WNH01125.1 DGQHR domain-containing protein [Xenorhabdus griffiniae]
MLENKKYTWNIPAIRSFQASEIQYSLVIPMRQLKRLLAFDNSQHVMSRSQRELNKNRAKKISQYLIKSFDNKIPYILPPLVGNIDSDIEFDEVGNDTRIGILKIPMDADITLFDGQHRAYGIIEFCKQRDVNDYISITLTENLDLETRQQFFSDINSNASKPSAAINLAYNNREDYSHLTRYWIKEIKAVSEWVDYEHNVIPSKSNMLISFKALYDATKRIFCVPTEDILSETIKTQAVAIWSSWAYLTGLTEGHSKVHSLDYRKGHITFHGVLVNAFSFAVCELLKEEKCIEDVIVKINGVACIMNETKRDAFFRIENWKGICVDPERGTIRADLKSQRAAGSHLLSFINCNIGC